MKKSTKLVSAVVVLAVLAVRLCGTEYLRIQRGKDREQQ